MLSGEKEQVSEALVTVTVILLLPVLFSAIVNVPLHTQGPDALGQAVDFQGECGDLIKIRVSVMKCHAPVRLGQRYRKFFQGDSSCFLGTHY